MGLYFEMKLAYSSSSGILNKPFDMIDRTLLALILELSSLLLRVWKFVFRILETLNSIEEIEGFSEFLELTDSVSNF